LQFIWIKKLKSFFKTCGIIISLSKKITENVRAKILKYKETKNSNDRHMLFSIR